MKWNAKRISSFVRPRDEPGFAVSVPLPALTVGRWIQRVLVSTAVLLSALAGWWWMESRTMEEDAARFEVATTRTQALTAQMTAQMAKDGLTLTTEQTARVRREVAFLNQLADRRAFSWVQLLDNLETTEPVTLAILSVKVNVQDSTVLLTGIAPDLQTLNGFVTALQQHRAFGKATLVNHQIQDDRASAAPPASDRGGRSAAAGPIEFSLTAHYHLPGEAQS